MTEGGFIYLTFVFIFFFRASPNDGVKIKNIK